VSAASQSAPPPIAKGKRRISKQLRKAAVFKQLGPGLITGAADDDPSGIAPIRVNMLWTMVLTYPLMTAVQLVSAQIGRVTGCGLAKNMGDVLRQDHGGRGAGDAYR
jgi:Mn2+/Fe2+ NRAMP family transporter